MTDAGVRPVNNGTALDHDPDPTGARTATGSVRSRQGTQGNTRARKVNGMVAADGTGRNTARKDGSEPNWLDGEPAPAYEIGAQDQEARSYGRTLRNGATRVRV